VLTGSTGAIDLNCSGKGVGMIFLPSAPAPHFVARVRVSSFVGEGTGRRFRFQFDYPPSRAHRPVFSPPQDIARLQAEVRDLRSALRDREADAARAAVADRGQRWAQPQCPVCIGSLVTVNCAGGL